MAIFQHKSVNLTIFYALCVKILLVICVVCWKIYAVFKNFTQPLVAPVVTNIMSAHETLVLSYFSGVLPLQTRAGAPKQLYVSHPQTLWLSTQHIYWEYQYWIQPNFIRSYYMSEDFEQREKWENSRRESAISLVGLWRRWGGCAAWCQFISNISRTGFWAVLHWCSKSSIAM